jgi:hypothetical protein
VCAHSHYSPQRVLQIAQRIQFHQATVLGKGQACGLSELDAVQREASEASKLEVPTRTRLKTAR